MICLKSRTAVYNYMLMGMVIWLISGSLLNAIIMRTNAVSLLFVPSDWHRE